jgi:hypothetical protein
MHRARFKETPDSSERLRASSLVDTVQLLTSNDAQQTDVREIGRGGPGVEVGPTSWWVERGSGAISTRSADLSVACWLAETLSRAQTPDARRGARNSGEVGPMPCSG